METSFTNLSPPEIEELNRGSSGAYSLGEDTNSLSWDYATIGPPTGRQLAAEPLQKNMPARPTNFRVDLSRDDWLGMAPLATPDAMSDTSSLCSLESRGSKRFSNGYGRIKAPPMDPIQQSPQRTTHSESHRLASPPSPIGFTRPSERDLNVVTEQSEAPEPVLQMAIPPLAQSTPFKVDVDGMQEECESVSLANDHDSAKDTLLSVDNVIPAAGEPCGLKLDALQSNTYVRHSPDSLSTCNQLVYDEHVGHYSPAGRGYPHGGYMPFAPNSVHDDDGDSSDWDHESGVVTPDEDENTTAKCNNESSQGDSKAPSTVSTNGGKWNSIAPGTAVTISETSLDTVAPLVRSTDWIPAMNGISSSAGQSQPTASLV